MIAGSLNPIMLGQIEAGGGADADATAFFTATGITDPTQQSAITTLVTDLKSNGLWSKMLAIYPFVGGTATTHKFNLKDPRDLDAAFRLVFSGTLTHSATGVLGGGGFADTRMNVASNLVIASNHLSFYSRTSNQNPLYGTEIGGIGTYSATSVIALRVRNATLSGVSYYALGNEAQFVGLSSTTGTKLTVGSATAIDNRKLYKDGAIVATSTATNTGTLPNFNIGLFTTNTGQGQSINEGAWASVGTGLTDSEVSTLTTIVNAYQTTLGRNV